jgi:thiamine-phosphate pyrophosphorylase
MTEDVKQDKPKEEKGAPSCGLYLRIPENPDMEVWQPRMLAMRFVVNNTNRHIQNMHVIECMLGRDASQEAIEKASAFVQISQLSGFVAIIKGDVKFAKALDADGVLLDDIGGIASAREDLGDEKIIGLSCAMDLELAKQALNHGSDYITFGNPIAAPDRQLIIKWSTTTEIPCAAIGQITNQSAGLYAVSGASFIDTTHYFTTQETKQATVNMLYEIDEALKGVKIN